MKKKENDGKPLLIVWTDKDKTESVTLIDGIRFEDCMDIARRGSDGRHIRIYSRKPYPDSRGELLYDEKKPY